MSSPIAYKSFKGNAKQRRIAVRKFKRSHSAFRVEQFPEQSVSWYQIFLDPKATEGAL